MTTKKSPKKIRTCIWASPGLSGPLLSPNKTSSIAIYARHGCTNVTCFWLAPNGPKTLNYIFDIFQKLSLGYLFPPSCLTIFQGAPAGLPHYIYEPLSARWPLRAFDDLSIICHACRITSITSHDVCMHSPKPRFERFVNKKKVWVRFKYMYIYIIHIWINIWKLQMWIYIYIYTYIWYIYVYTYIYLYIHIYIWVYI